MNLFQLGLFTLASGKKANWKIECDALTDADWSCVAAMIADRFEFSEVHGVPSGGNRLAELLQPSAVRERGGVSLIVDDVYTTGGSIRAMRAKLASRPGGDNKRYIGCVLFARARIEIPDRWVRALFQFQGT